MQNRYVGDIGDFVKLAMLRALSSDARRLGVFWWLFPDETHNSDGKHRQYLSRPEQWRQFDSEFDSLATINRNGVRDVRALENSGLLRGAKYFSELIPSNLPTSDRFDARRKWFSAGSTALDTCDLLFIDPDNGIAPVGLRPTRKRSGKSVLVKELCALQRPGRSLIIYHHQSRRPGGHNLEFEVLAGRLETAGLRVCGALRAKPWSARLFLIVDGDDDLCARARNIADVWGEKIHWLPNR